MVSTTTFISDTVLFIRNDLVDNVTDPISTVRPSNERFVMTSYPQRAVTYPIVTVKNIGANSLGKTGMGSEIHFLQLLLEIRVWSRNVKEKDNLTQEIINRLRSNEYPFSTSTTSIANNLHDFQINNWVDVDEDGEQGIKSKVIEVQYLFVLGQ